MRLVCCTASAHGATCEMGHIHLAGWQGAGAGIKAGPSLPTSNTALSLLAPDHGVPPTRMSGVLSTMMGGEGKAIPAGNKQCQVGTRTMVYPRE